MSSETFKSRQTNNNVSEGHDIEDYLQRIVNSLTAGFEQLKEGENTFKKFSNIFENSNTLEEIIKAISDLTEVLVSKIKANVPKEPLRIQQDAIDLETPMQKSRDSLTSHSQSNYDSLEKLLQKYEAEIRDHIRIEQQLKIYSESLEEKITEFEGSQLEITTKYEKIKLENLKLAKDLSHFKTENQNLERRLNVGKAKEVGLSQPRHSKSNSIESVL
jgi:hypothetical protein